MAADRTAEQGSSDLVDALVGTFGEEAAVALAPYAERVAYRAGELIFAEGTPSDSFAVVVDGEVRLEVRVPDVDTDSVLAFSGPGSLLGEVGLLADAPRSASAYAHVAVVLGRVAAPALTRMSAENPSAALAVVRALGRDAAHKLLASSRRVAESVAVEAPDPQVDHMVDAAVAAQRAFAGWEEGQVDALLEDLARTVADHAEELAAATVAETTIGNVPDKILKIQFASLGVYASLAGRAGRGELDHDRRRKTTELASPVGVVFALVPLTSPVATLVDNLLITLKGRNALIVSCHRRARQVAERTAALVAPVLERHGAPADLVQVVGLRASRLTTGRFMRHAGVAMILATGGRDMVTAAYSAGKPAIGVGPGNTPAWICADADLEAAAQAVVSSKAFDNGLVCGAEQHLVVDASVVDRFVAELEAEGAAVLDGDETRRFTDTAFDPATGDLDLLLVGRSATDLAAATGLHRDGAKVLVFRADRDHPEGAAARERLAPAVSLFVVDDDEQAIGLARALLAHEGAGHTAVIHTADDERVRRFAAAIPASRILVNVAASLGCCGVLTGLDPSFTLGCGTLGGNSTTDNVGYRNLVNVQRVARMQYDNMLRFRRLQTRPHQPSPA